MEPSSHDQSPCRARAILQRVGDKWSIYAVNVLGQGTKRFGELRKEIDGITPRMLTVTLRSLERDGLIARNVLSEQPLKVEYSLTSLGETLLESVSGLLEWADKHLSEIDVARARYDSSCAPECHAGTEESQINSPANTYQLDSL